MAYTWPDYQRLGYSREVDGAGGGHGTAVCGKHRDVACALAFVAVVVEGLQKVVMVEWVVTTGIYSAPDELSSLVRQHVPHGHLQSQQGHWARATKAQARLS